ncbi:hypothetical protein L207DRAFT_3946 [Hyaloscypha variabilis F]|uniref:Uncharacterized protein n=1 Tax=Hyaloscypha variabilis (strain UAMH 11265 / GT02V1 / F) TaxID=1149755 RepID=A0A2J6SBZ8_HYAVF|nr:hypothetical protein L207DRAFT_3946 [Hyaloscypha variabilis F]
MSDHSRLLHSCFLRLTQIYDLPAAPRSCSDRQLQAHLISAVCTLYVSLYCLDQNILNFNPSPTVHPFVATRCTLPKISGPWSVLVLTYPHSPFRSILQQVLTGGKGRPFQDAD